MEIEFYAYAFYILWKLHKLLFQAQKMGHPLCFVCDTRFGTNSS